MYESRSKSEIIDATVYLPPSIQINIMNFRKIIKSIYLFYMEKECKICKVTKPLKEYFSCQKCGDGHLGICKVCKKSGKTIRDMNPKKQPKFNRMWSNFDDNFMKMKVVTKDDYRSMYEFLKGCGYDVSKDIHQQFIDKWNATSNKKPLKYKDRGSNSINSYLWNGEINPANKRFKAKENPTD